MKKRLLLILLTFVLFFYNSFTNIQAKTNFQIIVTIKDAQDLYLISINQNTLKVKTISNKLYTNIACLNNEKSTFKSVDFTNSYPCLMSSIEQAIHTEIDYYVSIDMKKIVKALNIKENSYDYKSLKSLTNVSKQILEKFKLSLIINYGKYISTNLKLQDLYKLYSFFNNDHKNTNYYYLNYYAYNNKYFLFDTSFHLKK